LNTNTKYAGAGAVKSLTQADIQDLMNSIKDGNTPRGVSVDDQRVALAQILNVMDSAAKTTNANISVYSTAQSTYNPAPTSTSSGASK